MKKIALIISSQELSNWSGGLSYYINLINLIRNLKNRELLIYTDSQSFIRKLAIKKFFKIRELSCLKKGSLFFLVRKIIIALFKKDLFLYMILLLDKVNVLSHRKLFKNKNIKVLGWIPDLQQKVLSKFFKEDTLKEREMYILSEIRNSDFIFVSSQEVKKEFTKYYKLNNTIIPLRISSSFIKESKKKLILNKNIDRFILFPSQFWKHKNHNFLVKAAQKFKKNKLDIKIVLCGKIFDNRNLDHYKTLNHQIKKYKLQDTIINLGEVSITELEYLQTKCLAFINPSFYEGWSTINEESRIRNKYIFLSNIPGHIEQNNSGAIYFDHLNPSDFIRKLKIFIKKKHYKNTKYLKRKNNLYVSNLNKEAMDILRKFY
jgi:glycosyltransferase involved in cell wall biosynthesis